MFANLLPGVRDVRAPLAAGYLWLAAAWIALESLVPERAEGAGVVASIYRAGDLLSGIGVGFALSFAAYIVGSLSSGTLSPLSRRLFHEAELDSFAFEPDGSPSPILDSFKAYDPDRRSSPSPLSPQGEAALKQIVATSRRQLGSSLALTERDLPRFLEAAQAARRRMERPGVLRRLSMWLGRRRMAALPSSKRVLGPGYAPAGVPEKRMDAILIRAVLDDLRVVAKTRLLGRDQELYTEVDRNRAEADFRLAVIPPLFAVAIAVGVRSDPWVFALLAALGAMLVLGLFSNAEESEKRANEILLQSIEDRRVSSPTLQRWETEAADQASRTRPELLEPAAQDAVVALLSAASSLEQVGSSEPSLASYARKQVDLAQEPMDRVRQLFPVPVVRTGQEALELLTSVADDWVAIISGQGPPADDPRERLKHAQDLIAQFRLMARQEVEPTRLPTSARAPEGGGDDLPEMPARGR